MSDILKEYSGAKPPKVGINIIVTPQTMAVIGHIALQWGHLIEQIQFQIKFKSKFPAVPQELGERKVRHEATQQIKFLREIAGHIYAKERPTAVSEFNSILDSILRLKETRDALVHGTFALTDNKDPNTVVVHFRGGKKSFSLEKLNQTATEIGVACGTLMSFDQWVNYEKLRASLEKLGPQAHQS